MNIASCRVIILWRVTVESWLRLPGADCHSQYQIGNVPVIFPETGLTIKSEPKTVMLNMNRSACVLFCTLFPALVCAPPLQAQPDNLVDGVTVKDQTVYCLRGDQLEVLTENLELPFKVRVDTNGTFQVADGKERQLEAGQVLRRDGWLLNPDGSIQPVFDHVAMKEGRVIVVRDGQAGPLTEPMIFPNKLNVAPDGTCAYPDGSHSRLMDGQLFRLDGTAILSKDTVTLKNNRVVVQKEGKLITLLPVQIMGMNDGTRVRGDGLIQKHDGTTTQLGEGQTILVEGAIVGH
jgi:hypothetical protein